MKYKDVILPVNTDIGFHLRCYRKFTALSQFQREKQPESLPETQEGNEASAKKLTRADMSFATASTSTGIFPKVCLFCNKGVIRLRWIRRYLSSASTTDLEQNIIRYATLINDEHMLLRIRDIGFVAKEVHYHRICRTKYQTKALSILETDEKSLGIEEEHTSDWQQSRNTHSKAFEVVCDFVKRSISEEKEVHFMKELKQLYQAALCDIGGVAFDNVDINSSRLSSRLSKVFGEKIKIDDGNRKKGNIIYCASTSIPGTLRNDAIDENKNHCKIRDAALMLRRVIMEAPSERLLGILKLRDIYDGEGDVPDVLLDFFSYDTGFQQTAWKY